MTDRETLGYTTEPNGQVYSLDLESAIEDYALEQREQLYQEISQAEQRLHTANLTESQRQHELWNYNYTDEQIRKLTNFAINRGLLDETLG